MTQPPAVIQREAGYIDNLEPNLESPINLTFHQASSHSSREKIHTGTWRTSHRNFIQKDPIIKKHFNIDGLIKHNLILWRGFLLACSATMLLMSGCKAASQRTVITCHSASSSMVYVSLVLCWDCVWSSPSWRCMQDGNCFVKYFITALIL